MQAHRPLTFIRYARLVLVRAAREAFAALGLNSQTLITVVSYGAFLYWRFHRQGKTIIVNELSSWWSYIVEAIPPTLITIGILSVLFIVKAAYLTYKDATETQEKTGVQNIPQLEILFKNEEPFVHYSYYNDTTERPPVCSTIRVGVKADTLKTIKHCQLRVERLDFEKDAPLHNVPLQLMHDHFPFKDEFSIDPGETQFLNVATKGIIQGNIIHICHVISHEKVSFIEVKPHNLTLKATGEDALPATIQLRIKPNEKGLLTAKIIEG